MMRPPTSNPVSETCAARIRPEYSRRSGARSPTSTIFTGRTAGGTGADRSPQPVTTAAHPAPISVILLTCRTRSLRRKSILLRAARGTSRDEREEEECREHHEMDGSLHHRGATRAERDCAHHERECE